MKTAYVYEAGTAPRAEEKAFVLDLNTTAAHDCIGCWNCWQKTPGRCAFKELDDFYRAFLAADLVEFRIGVSCDFVSSTVKTLFDRMIPLFVPYTSWKTGESMHVPRYERYPDVRVVYEGTFSDEEARKLYEEYLERVFYQFHIQKITIAPATQNTQQGAAV